MENTAAIAVPRPRRWDEPMDPSMSDADVAWLRTRPPFSAFDPKQFPRSTPLDGILKNDCRIHRCEPGQVIVREGDYGNSAFLLLAGQARVMMESLDPASLGRRPATTASWIDPLWQFFRPDEFPETRDLEDAVPRKDEAARLRHVDGQSSIFLQDFEGVLCDRSNMQLGPGDLFGEVAAMYRSPRTATVVAETESTLLEVRWQGLKILRRDQAFGEKLEAHYRQQWLPVHLREVPLLRYLPEDRMRRVVEKTGLRSFGRLEWNIDFKKSRRLPPSEQIETEPLVIDEGQLPTELIIVRSGFGRLCRRHGDGHRTTAYLGKGHVFGLAEVAYNATRPPDQPPRTLANQLRAVGLLDTLHIPIEIFAEDILPYVRRSELPAEIQDFLLTNDERTTRAIQDAGVERRRSWRERRKNRRAEAAAKRATPESGVTAPNQFESTALLEFVVQERLNNGRQAMVIDLHRCTRCDDCVKACAATHQGNPRFVRDGQQHDRLQFVQACMQCTDPVCMIGCPTGAILRNEADGVIRIHERICVGCGTCANACPYDTIQMAEIADRRGRPYTDAASGKPIEKATKCDMCTDVSGGPACVDACPHDALVRIDLSESEPLQQWMERRS